MGYKYEFTRKTSIPYSSRLPGVWLYTDKEFAAASDIFIFTDEPFRDGHRIKSLLSLKGQTGTYQGEYDNIYWKVIGEKILIIEESKKLSDYQRISHLEWQNDTTLKTVLNSTVQGDKGSQSAPYGVLDYYIRLVGPSANLAGAATGQKTETEPDVNPTGKSQDNRRELAANRETAFEQFDENTARERLTPVMYTWFKDKLAKLQGGGSVKGLSLEKIKAAVSIASIRVDKIKFSQDGKSAEVSFSVDVIASIRDNHMKLRLEEGKWKISDFKLNPMLRFLL